MASSSQQSTANMGSNMSSNIGDLEVVEILQTTRNPEIWQHFDLCLMSDNKQKARCKTCGKFMGVSANSTLRQHMSKYCIALKSDAAGGQTTMGGDGGIWHYDMERVRDRMTKFVIQEALPLSQEFFHPFCSLRS